MKKLILLLTAIVMAALPVRAKVCEVQRLEGGFYVGPTMPLGDYHGGSSRCSATLGFNLSYNIPYTAFDCGVFFQMDFPFRDFSHWEPMYDMNGQYIGHWGWEASQCNRTLSLGAIGHYNFMQCSKINPFVGLGVGVGFNEAVGDVIYYSKGSSAVLIPQIGVEFVHLFRVTGHMMICRKGYNSIGITMGLSFGGRVRPQQKPIL